MSCARGLRHTDRSFIDKTGPFERLAGGELAMNGNVPEHPT
jgi:hypothetical protein